ncbi:hypothetical protein E8E13_003841 [Curvularia kusanoi]|uniref:Protein kinase domain-containing protein n=1 Tax=Curvularia kusanoi TaxID=90978 RepID=A0A9P4W8G0_CURKU|nr:hypothetical protein E8E13_003841 [Curvularia kusanoi]
MASTAAPQSWIWSAEHDDYYQYGVNSDGQLTYLWASQNAVTQAGEPERLSVILEKIDYYGSNKEAPYEHVDVLGRGHSGLVEKVRHRRTHQFYARKSMTISKRTKDEQEAIFRNEIAVIRRLCNHHHFIEVVEAYRRDKQLCIILHPVAQDGDWSEYLDRYWEVRRASDSSLKTMTMVLEQAFGCLVGALAFMHDQRIRHKDIKPHNVLVHSGTVLFTDFGYSLDSSQNSHSTSEGTPSFLTRRYCAPEVRQYEKRNSSSDVWSLGCVLIEIFSALTGLLEIDEKRLYSDTMPVLHGKLVNPASVPDRYLFLINILLDMTSVEASKRPNCQSFQKSLSSFHAFSCHKCQIETSQPRIPSAGVQTAVTETLTEAAAIFSPLGYRTGTRTEARSFWVRGRIFAILDDFLTRRFATVLISRGRIYACEFSDFGGHCAYQDGCTPNRHALIYNTGVNPESCYLNGEFERYNKPIRVAAADYSTMLALESRICFSKTYPIELNAHVKDLGCVVQEDVGTLLEQAVML